MSLNPKSYFHICCMILLRVIYIYILKIYVSTCNKQINSYTTYNGGVRIEAHPYMHRILREKRRMKGSLGSRGKLRNTRVRKKRV